MKRFLPVRHVETRSWPTLASTLYSRSAIHVSRSEGCMGYHPFFYLCCYPSSPPNVTQPLHFCLMRKVPTLHLLRDFSISFEKDVCIASIFSCICLTWDSIVKAFVMGFSASLLAISIASLVVLRWKTCSSSSISLSYMRRVLANERRGRHSKRTHQLDSISPERHTKIELA